MNKELWVGKFESLIIKLRVLFEAVHSFIKEKWKLEFNELNERKKH